MRLHRRGEPALAHTSQRVIGIHFSNAPIGTLKVAEIDSYRPPSEVFRLLQLLYGVLFAIEKLKTTAKMNQLLKFLLRHVHSFLNRLASPPATLCGIICMAVSVQASSFSSEPYVVAGVGGIDDLHVDEPSIYWNGTEAGGGASYHLIHDVAANQLLTLNQIFEPRAGGTNELRFQSRIMYARTTEIARVEISIDGGDWLDQGWRPAPGTNPYVLAESAFTRQPALDLSPFIDHRIQIRFSWSVENGPYVASAGDNAGWFIDDVEVQLGGMQPIRIDGIGLSPATAAAHVSLTNAFVPVCQTVTAESRVSYFHLYHMSSPPHDTWFRLGRTFVPSDNSQLIFTSKIALMARGQSARIQVSENGTNWSSLWTQSSSSTTIESEYSEISVPLGGYLNKAIYIRFLYHYDQTGAPYFGGVSYGWFIGQGIRVTNLQTVITTSVPVVNSPLTSSGVKDQLSNSYQITASNNPTGYGATGLPTGLSVDAASGLITGTPTISGQFSVVLSATNGAGTGTASLTLTVLINHEPVAQDVTLARIDSIRDLATDVDDNLNPYIIVTSIRRVPNIPNLIVNVSTSTPITPGVGSFTFQVRDLAGSISNEATVKIDSDGDGIPDEWEMSTFDSLNTAGGDLDGDGQSDAAEYAAGTTMTSATSKLEVTSFHRTAEGTVDLEWSSVPGKVYSIEYGGSLIAALSPNPIWNKVGQNILAISERTRWSSSVGNTSPEGFYRVSVTTF